MNFNEDSLLAVGPGQLCCSDPPGTYCPSFCSSCTVCPQAGYCAC